jgi:catechol 2,3-dioxygenase-like lactoylglutathione lyase family enzyme
MIDYVTLGTNNLQRAMAFYDAVLPTLGHARLSEYGGWAGYGRNGKKEPPVLWLCTPFNGETATTGNGTMVSFTAPTREHVRKFHAAALAAGGTDEGTPGVRKYAPNWYGAYVRDPDGNKLAVVCRHAE